MTWSIVTREPGTGRFAVAVASRFLAAGGVCPWARAGVGAVSTQAQVNPLYGPAILDRLARGETPAAAIAAATAGDRGREWRQVHGLDASGRAAAHTGRNCVGWCGHIVQDDVSVAGNMLAGEAVLQATLEAYLGSRGNPLAKRLLAALAAGEAAGGDKRGKQSAALLIQGAEAYSELDLRVDDHSEPIMELHRVYEISKEILQPFKAAMPTRERPSGIFLPDEREPFLAARRAELMG